jgi:hypothetical protein
VEWATYYQENTLTRHITKKKKKKRFLNKSKMKTSEGFH